MEFFSQYNGSENSHYDHTQWIEGSYKHWSSSLHHQSLNVVCKSRAYHPLSTYINTIMHLLSNQSL